MQIRIDTKTDSPDDIRKAIEFLSKFLEKNNGEITTADNGKPNSEAMFDMFGNTLAKKSEGTDKKDDEVRIIPY